MNVEIKKQWVAALRSGAYQQGMYRLRTRRDTYCCLGVLCDLYAKATGTAWTAPTPIDGWRYAGHDVYLPPVVVNWADINWADIQDTAVAAFGYNPCLRREDLTLSDLNDDGKSFNEIADAIESELEV